MRSTLLKGLPLDLEFRCRRTINTCITIYKKEDSGQSIKLSV